MIFVQRQSRLYRRSLQQYHQRQSLSAASAVKANGAFWFCTYDGAIDAEQFAGYRELRRRGVSVREAWNTSKSAHGPRRLSKTPVLALALPVQYFSSLGLPSLAAR